MNKMLENFVYYIKTLGMNIKITKYTQNDLDLLNDKYVFAYISNKGWVRGLFNFDIQTENFIFKMKNGTEKIYTRRTDTYKIGDFFNKISYVIWVDKNKGFSGLDPQYDSNGDFILANEPIYFQDSHKILYITKNNDNELFDYLTNNVKLERENNEIKQSRESRENETELC